MAGGPNKVGDMKNVYVIKANGSAVGRSSFGRLGFGQTWDGYQYAYHLGAWVPCGWTRATRWWSRKSWKR